MLLISNTFVSPVSPFSSIKLNVVTKLLIEMLRLNRYIQMYCNHYLMQNYNQYLNYLKIYCN